MSLAELLSADQIIPEMKATERWDAIVELMDLLVARGQIKAEDREGILASLKQREETMSTGIGFGIAIPHCSSDRLDNSGGGVWPIQHRNRVRRARQRPGEICGPFHRSQKSISNAPSYSRLHRKVFERPERPRSTRQRRLGERDSFNFPRARPGDVVSVVLVPLPSRMAKPRWIGRSADDAQVAAPNPSGPTTNIEVRAGLALLLDPPSRFAH